MKTIYLYNNKIQNYPLFYKGKSNESTIRDYSDTELIKIFNNFDENKLYTLDLMEAFIKDFKLVPELLLHKAYISNYIFTIGILIDKGYSYNLKEYFTQESTSFNDKIIILKNIGKVLNHLSYLRTQEKILETFFIGDLHESNILVDKETKKVQFIDLDSCKIGDNFPFLTKYLQFLRTYTYVKEILNEKYPWQGNYVVPNLNTELYSYILLILKYLFDIDIFLADLNTFYKQIYDIKKLIPEPLFQIFINLYTPVPNKNPYQLLDAIPEFFERQRSL